MFISLALAAAVAAGGFSYAKPPVLPALIPFPNHVEVAKGYFDGVPAIHFQGPISAADFKWLKHSAQIFLPEADTNRRGTLYFAIDSGIANPEGYRLTIGPDGIEVNASNPRGLFWAIQTLRQLHTAHGYPCGTIDDSPEFAWRGVMLDEGRHFMGEPFVKHLLDAMSLYKFNVLHWHLTDDQGWRVEIKSYPELTQVGAWRVEADGTKTDGLYTQDQIKEIVAYATSRNITIVPEIEMPGHSSAAIASIPELGCTRQQIKVPTTWGVFQDVYCAGRESTFKFLDDVLTEVVALFPGEYLHIGGDEVPKTHWHACPDCQARMKAEGLKDEHELQSYFVKRVQEMLGAKRRKLIGWDEIMEGGLAPGAVVQVWRDQAKAKEATDAGNPVILSPGSNCYLNRPADDLTLRQVYSYEPLQGIENRSLVKGIETTLWSENITTRNCLAMLMPRGLAISEIGWSSRRASYDSFLDRVHRNLSFLKSQGIDYGPEDRKIVSYSVSANPEKEACTLRAVFGMPDLSLRYTLDGSQPNESSKVAKDAIEWPSGKTLTVDTCRNGQPLQQPVVFSTTRHLALGKTVKFLTEPHHQYKAAGPEGLVDGIMGTADFHDGLWLGWDGVDMRVVLDLGSPTDIHEIGLHCLQAMPSWILMPTSVKYETSDDGSNWTPYGDVANTLSDKETGQTVAWFTARRTVTARYVKVTAKNYGKLPSWHLGAGGSAFIFADELAVNASVTARNP
jgi:hexosaminidase